MAQAVSRRLLTAEARVSPCVFVMDKVALGHAFWELFLSFTLSISFRRGSSCADIIWRMNNRPVDGSSSQTSSRPINMKNKLLTITLS
jgi:hypothetical protein